jgi:hypothetical protein
MAERVSLADVWEDTGEYLDMKHASRWIRSFACVVVGMSLGEPALAGPTGAHVPVAAGATHEIAPESLLGARPNGQGWLESSSRAPSTPIVAPSFAPPRAVPFWFGYSQLGVTLPSRCLNAVYGMTSEGPTYGPMMDSTMVRTPSFDPLRAASPIDALDCFHQFYSNRSSSLDTPLAPANNKDALYGPMYHPDPSIVQ